MLASPLVGESRFVAYARHATAAGVATQAGLALSYAHEINNLREGVATRQTIGQAVGEVMERYGLSPERAFAFLSRLSQRATSHFASWPGTCSHSRPHRRCHHRSAIATHRKVVTGEDFERGAAAAVPISRPHPIRPRSARGEPTAKRRTNRGRVGGPLPWVRGQRESRQQRAGGRRGGARPSRRPAPGIGREHHRPGGLAGHHAPGPQRVHLLGGGRQAAEDQGPPHPAYPGGARGGAAPPVLLARMRPPRPQRPLGAGPTVGHRDGQRRVDSRSWRRFATRLVRTTVVRMPRITTSETSVGISGTHAHTVCAQCRTSLTPIRARIAARP